MTVELEFMCDFCGCPVGDGKGCLVVFFADTHAYRQAKQDWQQAHGDGPHTLAQILEHPLSVPWRIHHHACNPDRDADGYEIEVSRVRTWRELLRWTAHLMEKNWLALTDWPQVIGAAAEGRSGRIKELAQGDAA